MALIAAFGDYGISDTLAESNALYDLLLALCEDRLAWDNILDKPELYTTDEVYNKTEIGEMIDTLGSMDLPINISDVTGLQDELDDRYTKTETDDFLDVKADTVHEHVVADITDFYDAVSALGIQIVDTLPVTVVNGKVYILYTPGGDKFTAYISSGGAYVPLDAVTYSALSIALATKQNLLTGTTGQYVRGDGSYATFNKAAIGLGDVNNTSDLNKPLSTAAITANLLKANDADVLHKDGDETKTSGVLTFAVSPIVPTPIGSGDAVPKGYLSTFLDSILGGDVDILGNLTVGGNVSILGELNVASTLLITNLNAEFLNGHPDTYFATATHVHEVLTPGTGLTGSIYDGSTPRTFAVDFGTAAGKAVEGTHVGSGGTAHANATTSVAGFMSAADKTAHDALVIGSVPSTRTITVNGTAGRISSSAGAQSLAADRTWTLDLVSAGTPGTYRSVTTDAYGRVTAGTNPTTVAGYGITDILAQVLTGYTTGSNTAITAASTILGAFQDVQAQVSQRVVNTRTLQFTGSAGRITSSNAVASDLSANRSWNFDLATAGTAGTYRSVTTDAYGRVTAGTNPTTISGYGITDLLSQVLTGYTVGSNTALTASDTLLTAFRNLQAQISAIGTGLSGYVPTSRTLTINGTAYDLSANRSWSVGTVTSVALSAPTGFSVSGSPVTTTGTFTLGFTAGYSLPSDATQATWTAKQAALSGTGLVKSTAGVISYITDNSANWNSAYTGLHNAVTLGTANGLSLSTQVLSLQAATTSLTGALTSTDWNTFNGKQAAITATSTADYYRGDKSFQTLNTLAVPELTNLYFTTARVLATSLTGYTAGSNTAITSGSTVLGAFQNLQAQISTINTVGTYVRIGTADTVTAAHNFTGSIKLPGEYFHNYYAGSSVYAHYYQSGGNGSTSTDANLRVWDGVANTFKALRFGGDGVFTWDGLNIATQSWVIANERFNTVWNEASNINNFTKGGVRSWAAASNAPTGYGTLIAIYGNTDTGNTISGAWGHQILAGTDENWYVRYGSGGSGSVSWSTTYQLWTTKQFTSTDVTNWNSAYTASHAAVTLGTANGLGLSTQVLSLALSSTSTTGALSSTNWNTFNGKMGGSGTSTVIPVFSAGTTLADSILSQNSGSRTVTIGSASTASTSLYLPNYFNFYALKIGTAYDSYATAEAAILIGGGNGSGKFSGNYGQMMFFSSYSSGAGGGFGFFPHYTSTQAALRISASGDTYVLGTEFKWNGNTLLTGDGDATYVPMYSSTSILTSSLVNQVSGVVNIGGLTVNSRTFTLNNYYDFYKFSIITQADSYSSNIAAIVSTSGNGSGDFANYGRLLFFDNNNGEQGGMAFFVGSRASTAALRINTDKSVDFTAGIRLTNSFGSSGQVLTSSGGSVNTWTTPSSTDTWQDVMNRGATSTVRPVIKAGPATGGYDFLRLEPTDYATGKHAFAFTADSPGVWAIYAFDGSTFGTINIIGTGQLNGAPLVTSSSSTLFTSKSGAISQWTNDSNYATQSYVGSQGFITASSSDTLTNKSGNISQWTNDSNYATQSYVGSQGFITASSSDTLTNKSGNISQWSNDSNYATQSYVTSQGYISSAYVYGQTSLTGGGNAGSGTQYINLVNDSGSPGNNMLYGTNGSGTKGWYAQPSGGGGISGSGTTNKFMVWTGSTSAGNAPMSSTNSNQDVSIDRDLFVTRNISTSSGYVYGSYIYLNSLSTTSINALGSVPNGTLAYNNTLDLLVYRSNGGSWKRVHDNSAM